MRCNKYRLKTTLRSHTGRLPLNHLDVQDPEKAQKLIIYTIPFQYSHYAARYHTSVRGEHNRATGKDLDAFDDRCPLLVQLCCISIVALLLTVF